MIYIILINISILILFIVLNYILKIYTEHFDSTDGIVDLDSYPVDINFEDICNRGYSPLAIIRRQRQRKRNMQKKIVTKVITNLQGDIIDEEIIPIDNCSTLNEKCLIDETGQNTCCGNLKCVRLKKDYGYKVCSYQEDACGHNKMSFTVLNKLFTFNILDKLLDDKWWDTFLQTRKSKKNSVNDEVEVEVEEEDNQLGSMYDYGNEELNKLRDQIKEKTNDLCEGKKLDGQLFQSYIKGEIQTLLIENEIFAGLIFGMSQSAKSKSETIAQQQILQTSTQYDNNERDCGVSKKNMI